jgi:capsule polysaccharide export protein KpsE/RkpR
LRPRFERRRRYAGTGPQTDQPEPEVSELQARIESLERQLKGARTQIKNLKQSIWTMPRATFSAIVNVLHADKQKAMTQAQRDDALGRLTDWWQKTSAARR